MSQFLEKFFVRRRKRIRSVFKVLCFVFIKFSWNSPCLKFGLTRSSKRTARKATSSLTTSFKLIFTRTMYLEVHRRNICQKQFTTPLCYLLSATLTSFCETVSVFATNLLRSTIYSDMKLPPHNASKGKRIVGSF